MLNRTVYSYDGNKIEKSWFDRDGKVSSKTIEVYDDKANLIEKTFSYPNTKLPDSTYTFTYDSFDKNGNWTKRIVYGKDGSSDGTDKQQHYIEYRTLTYYQ